MSSVLMGPNGMGIVLVDITSDFNVSVTTEENRNEGSPQSALRFAAQMRRETGEPLAEIAQAIEEAARLAIKRRALKYPVLLS